MSGINSGPNQQAANWRYSVPNGDVSRATYPGDVEIMGELILNEALPGEDVSFIQAGTGAVLRTMQDKARERVSPEDFGAVGNGATDDSAAFTAAIAALVAMGGGTLKLSDKVYRVQNIALPGNIDIEGAGPGATSLEVAAAGQAIFRSDGPIGVLNHAGFLRIGIRNLTMNGRGIGNGYFCKGVAFLKFENVYCTAMSDYGIRGIELWDSVISKCLFVNFTNPAGTAIIDLLNDDGTALVPDNTNNIYISDCNFETYMVPAIRCIGVAGPETRNNHIFVRSCKFESVHVTQHFVFENALFVWFDQFLLSNATTDATPVYPVTLNGVSNFAFCRGNITYIDRGVGTTLHPMFRLIGTVSRGSFADLHVFGLTTPPTPVSLAGGAVVSDLSARGCSVQDSTRTQFIPPAVARINPVADVIHVLSTGVEPYVEINRSDATAGGRGWQLGRITAGGQFRILREGNINIQITPAGEFGFFEGVSLGGNPGASLTNMPRINRWRIFDGTDGALRVNFNSNPASGTAGQPIGRRVTVPATATSAGVPGDFASNASFAYFYNGDGTTHAWARVAIAAW